MPKNPSYNVTMLKQEDFESLRGLIARNGNIKGVSKAVGRIIVNQTLDFTNIKGDGMPGAGENLLALAIIWGNTDVINELTTLATEDEIEEAKSIAQRNVNPTVVYVNDPVIDEEKISSQVKGETSEATGGVVSLEAVPEIVEERQISIHEAIIAKDMEALNKILKVSPSEVNAINPSTDITPIGTAIFCDWLEGVKVLIKAGADKETLLRGALLGAHEEIIKWLVAEGVFSMDECLIKAVTNEEYANSIRVLVQIEDKNGNIVNKYLNIKGTALHNAVDAENSMAIEQLVTEHNAKTEVRNDEGETPLQYAARAGKVKSFGALIEQKASLEVLTNDGQTLLHIAHPDVTKEIMKLPESEQMMQIRDHAYNLPIHTAAFLGHEEALGIMFDQCPSNINKADLLAEKGGRGQNVLEMAKTEAIKEKLIKYGAQEVAEEVVQPTAPDLEPTMETTVPYSPPRVHKELSNPSTPVRQIRKDSAPFSSPGTPKIPSTPKKPEDIKSPVVNAEDNIKISTALIQAIYHENIDEIIRILAENRQLKLLEMHIDDTDNLSNTIATNTKQIGSVSIIQFVSYKYPQFLDRVQEFWIHPKLKTLMKAISADNYDAVTAIMNEDKDLSKIKLVVAIPGENEMKETIHLLDIGDRSVHIKLDPNKNNMNLLHVASWCNKPDAALALLHNCFQGLGDEVDTATGYSAMHYAVFATKYYPNIDIQNIISILPVSNLSIRADVVHGNETPDEMAAFFGLQKAFEHVIQRKLGVEKSNLSDLITPLHMLKAIKGEHPEMIKELFVRNQTLGNQHSKNTGCNFLMESVRAKKKETFDMVFKYTKDIKHYDKAKQNILHHIAKYGSVDMLMTIFCENKEAFNELVQRQDDDLNTPLHIAANRDNEHWLELQNLLSQYTSTTLIKGGFFKKDKIQTEHKKINEWLNKDKKTPGQIHKEAIEQEKVAKQLASYDSSLSLSKAETQGLVDVGLLTKHLATKHCADGLGNYQNASFSGEDSAAADGWDL